MQNLSAILGERVKGGPASGGLPFGLIAFTPERLAYYGPASAETDRILGAYTTYVSIDRPFGICLDGAWEENCHLALVPPYTRHSLRGMSPTIALMQEAESVIAEDIAERWRQRVNCGVRWWTERVVEGFERWRANPGQCQGVPFDVLFIGEELPRPRYDWRINQAIELLRAASDDGSTSVEAMAAALNLSGSRLRHRFREEVGVPIRRFRSWKRLRKAIQLSIREPNLLQLAIAAGYAHSSHFSNSVRSYLGDQPRNLCAKWSNLSAFVSVARSGAKTEWLPLN